MRYARLLGTFFRIGLISELQYRTNFFVQAFQSVVGLLTGLGGLAIVFGQTDNLDGWLPEELLAVLGVYILIGGIVGLIVRPSLERFMEDVRQGTLDFALTKPLDSQVYVSTRQLEIWRLFDVGLGIAVIIIALVQIGNSIGIYQAVSFGIVLFSGSVIVYSFLLSLATLAFWFIRVENLLVIFESMYQAGRWPITIYPQPLRAALTFLVPVAFAVTVPAQALTGKITWQLLVGAIMLSIALLLFSRWFWHQGIRHYSGASA